MFNSLAYSTSFLGAVAAVTVISALLVARSRCTFTLQQLPPGPPFEPLIGSLRSMPSKYQWITFAEWSKKWGDIVYASVFGSPIIVLNSINSARELLDHRGLNYCSRPRAVIWNEVLAWNNLATMPYGDRFRRHRRLMSQVLNPQAIVVYRELQTRNTKATLKNLLRDPEKFEHYISQQAYSTIIRVTYGLNDSGEDSLSLVFEEALRRLMEEGAPGTSIIDHFPILKYLPPWFPGGGIQNRLKVTRAYIDSMVNLPFERALAEREKTGSAKPSFVGTLLDDYEATGKVDLEFEDDLKLVASVMYAAGVESAASTMTAFFLMMSKHPEVVKRAHLEIDQVTHKERLPTLADRPNLPVVDCIMKEVFRLCVPGPLGIPHCNLEEDTYRNMRIPRGSTVITNMWQMLRDPAYFPNPEIFDPERFRSRVESLEGNSMPVLNRLDNDDPSAIVFGFGRRICPGRYFADVNMWLLMSNILAMFDIGPPLDSFGKAQEIGEVQFSGGLSSRPMPFKCTIRPRDAQCKSFLEELEVEDNL